jgi:arylsulfatase A-like enzyme
MCTPTRATLLTGRYPFRYGLQTGVIPSGGSYGLSTEEWLLPQALKEAGYKTALIGKWHLGHARREFWPRQRGFDHSYGPLIGADIDHFTHESHGVVDWYRDNALVNEPGYDTTLFGSDAVELISAHDPQIPLFLYLAFTAPHTPYQAPQEYLDKYKTISDPARRTYAAQITAMDDEIGKVVAALERRGMRQNALIIFHSDNGGTRSSIFAGESAVRSGVNGELPPDNGIFRDGKGTLYEGGTRVCGLVNWTGRISAGKASGPIHVVDMFPTLAALAGAKLDKTKPLDGYNVWEHLSQGKESPRQEVIYNIEPFRAGVQQGNLKLVWVSILPERVELYDLSSDPSEAVSLATNNPIEVKKLQKRAEELAKESVQPLLLGEMIKLTFSTPPSTPPPSLSSRSSNENFLPAIEQSGD